MHTSMTRPLDGITVVSLEHAIAAPFATRQLADLGARVIKIERPGKGDFARHYDNRVNGLSSHFVWTNRSKESLALDVKHPLADDAIKRLISQADVLVQNLAPGAASRLGLTYDALKAAHPQLIVCNISGFGPDGPDRDRKAYDLLVQAEAGFLSITGTPETPVKSGVSIADIAAGMYAYSNILAALIQRGRTGKGACIEISMLEAMIEWMGYPMYYAFDGASAPPRSGASHATISPYGPYTAGDGQVVMLGLQNEREWATFCTDILRDSTLVTDARFVTNAARSENRATLTTIVLDAFASLDADTLTKALDAAGIANARVNDMAGLWDHKQLQARDRWVSIDSPVGELPALLPPGQGDSFSPRMDAVPSVGQHSEAILGELGLKPGAIAQLLKTAD